MFAGFGRDLTTSGATNDGMCADSPITYNVTLRGGVHSGTATLCYLFDLFIVLVYSNTKV